MHPNREKVAQVITMLRYAKDQAVILLDDSPDFKNRVESAMTTLANSLEFAIGKNIGQDRSIVQSKASSTSGPRTFMGMPVPEVKPVEEQLEETEPAADDLDQLRTAVDNGYATIPGMSNRDIRNFFSELELRGVAKRAGLDVTMTEPEKITDAFINEIKEAIVAKNAQDVKVKTAEANADLKAGPAGPAQPAATATPATTATNTSDTGTGDNGTKTEDKGTRKK